MIPEQLIDFIAISTSDSTRLMVLKSTYNRFANRLNASRFSGWKPEHKELLVQLKYLKEQIDAYAG
jgi:hypothetical protein